MSDHKYLISNDAMTELASLSSQLDEVAHDLALSIMAQRGGERLITQDDVRAAHRKIMTTLSSVSAKAWTLAPLTDEERARVIEGLGKCIDGDFPDEVKIDAKAFLGKIATHDESTLNTVFAKIEHAKRKGQTEVHCVALDPCQLEHLRGLGYTATTEHSQIGDHKSWSVVRWKKLP